MTLAIIYATHDGGLAQHWRNALQADGILVPEFAALHRHRGQKSIIWLDTALPGKPDWPDAIWRSSMQGETIIAASSSPNNDEAMAALDDTCAGYCHAYADPETLRQVHSVVAGGGVWVGRELMSRLLGALHSRLPIRPSAWHAGLTAREKEVAEFAARGLANSVIAAQCGISERTVKAHLTATFEKLGIVDRLQLALRVHGIS